VSDAYGHRAARQFDFKLTGQAALKAIPAFVGKTCLDRLPHFATHAYEKKEPLVASMSCDQI